MIVETLRDEGINAHDVGMGWSQQMNRMKAMKNMGIDIPQFRQVDRLSAYNDKSEYTKFENSDSMNGHYWVKVKLANIINQYGAHFDLFPDEGQDRVIIEIE